MKHEFTIYHGHTKETWVVSDLEVDGFRRAKHEEYVFLLYSPQVPDAVRSAMQTRLLDVIGTANIGFTTDPKELTKAPLYVKVGKG